MSLPDFLAVLVIFVLLPLLLTVAVILGRRSRLRPAIRVLSSDALAAKVLVFVCTVYALVYLNNGMADPILDPYWTMVVTRSALLTFAIPAVRWLWIYRPRKSEAS